MTIDIKNEYNIFLNNCTEEQKEIINTYLDNNFNMISNNTEYTMVLDGNYNLEQLKIFVKILDNFDHCDFLVKFDKKFPIDERWLIR